MRTAVVTPTGREAVLADDDVIVSKTDLKGVITYANDTFCRFAQYPMADLLGQPHNIIRHPTFPGGVFKLLWDTIDAGHEIFAFVQNMSRTGDHYWVLAHVTPSLDAAGRIRGYHSWRRRPEPAAVREIDGVYDLMRTEEKKHRRAIDAAAASATLLGTVLDQAGATYDEFVWDLIARTTPGLR